MGPWHMGERQGERGEVWRQRLNPSLQGTLWDPPVSTTLPPTLQDSSHSVLPTLCSCPALAWRGSCLPLLWHHADLCRAQTPTALAPALTGETRSPSLTPLPASPWVSPVLCGRHWGGWASQRPRFVSALVAMLMESGAGAQTEGSPGPAPAPSPLMDTRQQGQGAGLLQGRGCRWPKALANTMGSGLRGGATGAWPFLAHGPG